MYKRQCQYGEPLSILIFGKTHGDFKWSVIYADTVADLTDRSSEARVLKGIVEGMRGMVAPTIGRTVAAYGEAMLPCSTMCTVYHQRVPTPLRPRLIVAHYADKWMILDKFSVDLKTWRATQSDKKKMGFATDWVEGNAPAHVARGFYDPNGRYRDRYHHRRDPWDLGLLQRPTPWAQPIQVEGYEGGGLLAPTPPSDTTAASDLDNLRLTEEDEANIAEKASLRKYTEWNDKRNDERAKLEVETEEAWEFKVGESLRVEWKANQKRDAECIRAYRDLQRGPKQPKDAKGVVARIDKDMYRVGTDGLLERRVVSPNLGQPEWVPVVPDGYATGHLTWKKMVFQQCHLGILGGHRSADKTYACMKRLCWWKNMKSDVDKWVKSCGTCLRFRAVPQKIPTGPSVPADMECWQEVMIDLEGPNPMDRAGNRYYMTYICCLCHGVFLAGMRTTEASEARRAFAICMFRSGTIPS